MHNTQDQQQHHHQHWKRTALQASVMRGNVIVSRSEITNEPTDFDTEQSDLFSQREDGHGDRADVTTEVPIDDSNKVFHTLQPVTFEEYPPPAPQHSGHDGCLNQSGATAEVEAVKVQTIGKTTNVQLEKTDHDDQNKEANQRDSRTDWTEAVEESGSTKEATKSFVCKLCQKTFKHKSYFHYHMRTHTGERPFNCELCGKSFFERSKLNRHMSTCHNMKSNDCDPSDEPLKTCPQCNKSFSRITGLQTHILTHHEGGRPYSCTKCDKKFSGMTALKNHQIWHEGKKNLCCDLCGKTFLLKKYLDLHLKSTHKQEERKHFCTVCKKGFLFEKDLRRHQVSHDSGKSFACTFCDTFFKRKDNLHRHFKLTHLLSQEQIDEVSGNAVLLIRGSDDAQSANSANVANEQSSASKPENSPVMSTPINQVSVIKSTHEVIMSITRGQPYM